MGKEDKNLCAVGGVEGSRYYVFTEDGRKVECNGKPKTITTILEKLSVITFGALRQKDGSTIDMSDGQEVAIACYACVLSQIADGKIHCKGNNESLLVAEQAE